jgi:hypothetical protein
LPRATPLFCSACAARHLAEEQPPTFFERARTVFFTEQAIPAYCMIPAALFSDSQLARPPSGGFLLRAVLSRHRYPCCHTYALNDRAGR